MRTIKTLQLKKRALFKFDEAGIHIYRTFFHISLSCEQREQIGRRALKMCVLIEGGFL
jgi:hypothetical protein